MRAVLQFVGWASTTFCTVLLVGALVVGGVARADSPPNSTPCAECNCNATDSCNLGGSTCLSCECKYNAQTGYYCE